MKRISLCLLTLLFAGCTTAPVAKKHLEPTTFPYKREEVTFKNTKGGNSLAGTLTTPANGKVFKIVVLITGSGPQNRDEEIKTNKSSAVPGAQRQAYPQRHRGVTLR
jgi:hypothetical protein